MNLHKPAFPPYFIVYLAFFSLCFFAFPVRGNSNTQDSIKIWEKVADSLLKTDKQKSLYFFKKALLSSKDKGEHLSFLSRISLLEVKIKQYDSAQNNLKKCVELALELDDTSMLANSYNNLGVLHTKIGDIPKGLNFFKQAAEVYRKAKNDKLHATCLLNIGIIYKKYSVYDKASQHLYQAIDIFEKSNSFVELASAYNTLGNIRFELHDSINTLPLFNKSLSIRKRINHKKGIAGSLNNIGLYFKWINQLDSAKKYFEESLLLKNEIGDKSYIASTLTNIADVYITTKEYSKAKLILKKSLSYSSEVNNMEEMADIYNKLSSLAIAQKNISSAKLLLHKGINLANSIDNLELLKESFSLKIKVLEYEGNYKQAFLTTSKLLEIKDQILSKEKNKALTEMQIKYEVEKQKQANQLLHEETVRQQAQLEAEQFKNLLYGVLSFALLILSSILFFFFRQRSKHNKLLKALLNEQQHRIKNFLQTIGGIFRMHARKAEHEEVKLAVKEGSDRLEAMTLIHNQLYRPSIDAPAAVNFTEFTQKLVTNISSAYAGTNEIISPELELDNIDLDVNKAVALGLILNEVVNNSFKYAIPNNDNPKIVVKLKFQEETLVLEIKDNGPGLPPNQKEYRKGSLGMNLIKLFAKNLNAKYDFKSNKGLVFILECSI